MVKPVAIVSLGALLSALGAWLVWPGVAGFVWSFAAGWCAALAMVMFDLRKYVFVRKD